MYSLNQRFTFRYTFEGAPVVLSVLDFGGAIQTIMAPDKSGNKVDIALGYDDVAGKRLTESKCWPYCPLHIKVTVITYKS